MAYIVSTLAVPSTSKDAHAVLHRGFCDFDELGLAIGRAGESFPTLDNRSERWSDSIRPHHKWYLPTMRRSMGLSNAGSPVMAPGLEWLSVTIVRGPLHAHRRDHPSYQGSARSNITNSDVWWLTASSGTVLKDRLTDTSLHRNRTSTSTN